MFGRSVAIVSCVVAALFAIPMPSRAVTIGLDKGTLGVLERLPADVRKALLELIKEALPLVDKSVAEYLKQVDTILSENIKNGATAIQCSGVGAIEIVEKDISTSIANMLYTASRKGLTGKSTGDYTQTLSDSITTARNNMNVNTEATQVLVAYSDLLIQASVVKCIGDINPPITKNELDAQIKRVLVPQLEWDTLIGDRDRPYCKKVTECTVKRRTEIANYLARSNPDDIIFGKKLLASIPADPAIHKPFNPFATPSIQILDYEDILASLRTVERVVEVAKAERLAKAEDLWDKAVAARDNAVAQANNNEANINGPNANWVDMNNAIQRSPGMISKSQEAINLANQALATDASYKQQVAELTTAMNNNIARVGRIRAAAQGTLNKWDSDLVKQQMQEKRDHLHGVY